MSDRSHISTDRLLYRSVVNFERADSKITSKKGRDLYKLTRNRGNYDALQLKAALSRSVENPLKIS